MKIQNHKLVPEAGDPSIEFLASPNQDVVIVPKYLVVHYTAGRNAQSSIDWFKNPGAKASAQLVIAADGKITQMVPFNKRAYHAGKSKWGGLVGMNTHSIGIELDNPGKLSRVGTRWLSWFGKEYPDEVVLSAMHKHQDNPSGWHIFTEQQIDACIRVSQVLVTHYGLLDILGHEDISPLRKEDPGPAFPMEPFKSKVLGRQDDTADLFSVNTDSTKFRSGPGTQFAILGNLKKGTKVEFIKTHMGWHQVFLVKKIAGINEPEGWIHSSLLTKL